MRSEWFDFDWQEESMDTEWLIEGILPKGALVFLTAQAGTGKGWFIQDMVSSLIWGRPFMQHFAVNRPCNVMLIDQDSPDPNVIKRRFVRFGRHNDGPRVGNILPILQEGMSIGPSMIDRIRAALAFCPCEVVIIDSLSKLCGGLSMVKQENMTLLGDVAGSFPGITFVVTHHITEKLTLTVDDLMTCDTHSLSMYSSAINQQADLMYYFANPAHGDNCDNVYVRPHYKRYAARTKPFIWRLHQDPDKFAPQEEWLEYVKEYVVSDNGVSKQESLILQFVNDKVNTANGILKAFSGSMCIETIRLYLHRLEDKGLIESNRVSSGGKSWRYEYQIKEMENLEGNEMEPKETKETKETNDFGHQRL